jgi:hypothetical protein
VILNIRLSPECPVCDLPQAEGSWCAVMRM